MQSKTAVCVALVSVALCTGCYRLKVRLVDASVQKPSNVALYFSIDNRSNEPVSGLKANDFQIYEDNRLISEFESKQTILNPEVATVRYTVLLLDLSGSVVESGQLPLLQEAASAFLAAMPKDDPVAIYAFDGREDIIPIAKFGTSDSARSRRTDGLGAFKSEDPSTNLNGAVIKAVELIEEAKNSSEVPLRFGTLVIFTDGTDRAHRATSQQARRALVSAEVESYLIGLGGEVDAEEMKRLSTTGFVHHASQEDVVGSFREMGEKLKAQGTKYYLLSYCSPSRAGKHKITVKTAFGKDKGKLGYAFNADGFEPDCDPYSTPGFEPLEEAERQAAAKRRAMDKGVKGKNGVRQVYDDEAPPSRNAGSSTVDTGKKSKSNSADTPPSPSY